MQTAALVDSLARCHTLSSTLVVIGIGDGDILKQINADPGLCKKDIRALALPGETLPEPGTFPTTMAIDKVGTWEHVQQWIFDRFGTHTDTVRLAGADFLDTHELGLEATMFREEMLPRINATLADRPWALGNDINDTFMGLYHSALNAKVILPSPSLGNVCGAFQAPAISVGAGPSVKDHLEELRQLQNRCIIVACDAVYPALIKEGIVPHFVCPLERLKQQAPLLQSAQGTRTIFAGIPACHPDTVAHFENRTLYVHAMDRLYDWLAPTEPLRCITGSSTGVLSFLIAASLTRGPVYLVGHDLSRGEHGSHFEGCELAAKAFAHETKASGVFGANGYEERFIPGNDGGMVQSTTWWDTFRLEIAKLCNGRVFNTNGHARQYALIENTIAQALPDPSSLQPLPEIRTERSHDIRYQDWKSRALLLPADCRNFVAAMDLYRDSIRQAYSEDPKTWNIEALMERMSPSMGVSPGNATAFEYFLRSAITNEQMYMSYRVRDLRRKEQCYFHTMQSLDGLADAMTNAVKTLTPCLEEIANVC